MTITAWLLVGLVALSAALVLLALAASVDDPVQARPMPMHPASAPLQKRRPTTSEWSAPLVPGYVRTSGPSGRRGA